MKYILCLTILLMPGLTRSQNSTLHSPNSIFLYEGDRMPSGIDIYGVYIDSMIYETKRGRACEKVVAGLTRENSWLDSLRQTQDQEIALYQDVIANQNEILAGFPRELKANAQTCEAEKKALKRQIRRARRAAIVTGAGLAFCLVLLL